MKYLLEGVETARLRFRLLEDHDFDTWKVLFEEKDAVRFLGMDPAMTPEECCRYWFERGKKRYENDLGGMNVLTDKQSGALIGQAGLLIQEVDHITHMEIGYSMLPSYWGMGYATEAARRCRDHAFEQRLTEELISIIHTENKGSMKVAMNNGMKLWKQTDFKGAPVNIFRILKTEWQQAVGQ